MSFFKKILAFFLSILFYSTFVFFICLFHPLQWIALRWGNYHLHKKTIDILSFISILLFYILGIDVTFINRYTLDNTRPYIIISNHQSIYEISILMWFFRKLHPKFIAKKQLGKGIPSISFNLKYGGNALIDRTNPKQSVSELIKLADYLKKHNRSVVIFPEGTRAKDGKPKKFNQVGLKILINNIPNAVLLPITINNSWKLLKYGSFPLNIGINITCETHQPIETSGKSFDELLAYAEEKVKNNIILD